MLLRKNESSLEKENSLTEGFFFFQVSQNALRNSLQNKGSDTKFSY